MNRETIIRTVIAGALVVAILFGWQKVGPTIERMLGLSKPAAEAPAKSGAEKKPAAEKKAPEKGTPEKGTPEKAPAEKGTPEKGAPEKAQPPAVTGGGLHAIGAETAPAQPIVLGSAAYESDYDLAATINARGATVERLALSRRDYFRSVEDRDKSPGDRAAMDLIEPDAPVRAFSIPELRVRLRGADEWSKVDLSDIIWKVVDEDGHPGQAVLAVDVVDSAGKRLLEVRKTFRLSPRAKAAEAGGAAMPQYQLEVTLDFTALDDRVEKIMYELQGSPALPVDPGRSFLPTAIAGSWSGGVVQTAQVQAKQIKKGEELPAPQFLAGEEKAPEAGAAPPPALAWAGEMDKYFAVVLIPQKPSAEGTFVSGAQVAWYRVSRGDQDTAMPGMRLVTKELAIGLEKPVSNACMVYAGPKDAELLEKYYGHLGLQKLILWAVPCCGAVVIPGVDYLARLLALVLDVFYDGVRNYGIAIILLVFVLRAVTHPITRWSMKSMTEMQKLQPKMEQIRKQHADDKETMQRELAKVGGLKTMGGCLPMFLQMPIWLALYSALGASIHLRHAAFIPGAWLPHDSMFSMFLQDLSSPDMLLHWHKPFFIPGVDIPLLGWLIGGLQGMLAGGPGGITNFNLLPVLVGLSMYLQQLVTPQPPTTNPQAAQQRKMMNLMSVFFAVMLYSLPAGLCLYISASSFLGFFEQRWLRKKLGFGTPGSPALSAEPPVPEVRSSAPAKAAKEHSLVSGRSKSIAEQIEAWIRRLMDPGEPKAPETKKGKKKRGK